MTQARLRRGVPRGRQRHARRTGRPGEDAGGPSSKLPRGKNRNDTIDCLLNLRSVRDQFKDAELDLSDDKIADRLRELEDRLVDHLAEERDLRDGVGLLTVAVVGDFNSGKSTFINALLGTKLCPVGNEPTTASITYFIHGDRERYELERDGTRTSIERGQYLSIVRHSKSKVEEREANVFHVSIDSPVLEHVRLVDTPGFNAPPPNSNDTKVTEDSIATADVLFLIIDARKGNPSKSLLEQLDRLRTNLKTGSGPPAFLLLNKAELLPPSQREEVKRVCESRYDDRFRSVTPVSALSLNETDDSGPLDLLETIARRIRGALSRQESFEAKISAGVMIEQGQTSYRMDIDGNVCRSSVLSDGDLASREQLVEMVQSVAPERHSLLEERFRRRTSQLRKDWLTVASDLESLCKRRAEGDTSATGDALDEHETRALKEIDDAKDVMLEKIHGISDDIFKDIVSKKEKKEERFLSSTTFYIVDVCFDEAYRVVEDHEFWNQIRTILSNLIDSLKRVADVEYFPKPDVIAADLPDVIAADFKRFGVDIACTYLECKRNIFEESDEWERKNAARWRCMYKDEDAWREEHYARLVGMFESDADQWVLEFSQSCLQPLIDDLQESIIRYVERGQAKVAGLQDELTRLRERVAKLKEHTP